MIATEDGDGGMRLADFILRNLESIVSKWEAFASLQLPAAAHMDELALRDHAEGILRAIAADLETYQSREAQVVKSLGQKPAVIGAPETAAQAHAILRARDGFDINQLAAEYRALRASVLRLWTEAHADAPDQLEQVMRFNEAVDEALAESIVCFHEQVERDRNLLLGVLGHDLRSPLQSIRMTATYLTGLNVGSEVSNAAARLIGSGARMQALLDDLRDYNRTKLGMGINIRPTPIDAARVVDEELSLLRAAYPKHRFDVDVTGATEGTWDGMRLRQVLSNLIENAIKYGRHASPIQVTLVGEDSRITLAVKNEGQPIEPSAIKGIFDPTRRSQAREENDASVNSLGLGLFIARQIVEAHGGEISAQSANGHTALTVRLPRQSSRRIMSSNG